MKDLNRPTVIIWFKAYCSLLAIIHLPLLLLSYGYLCALENEEGLIAMKVLFSALMVISLAVPAMSLLCFFLKRQPWVWVYSLVLICLGMATWLLPFCIPLIIFWVKQNTKVYYQVNS